MIDLVRPVCDVTCELGESSVWSRPEGAIYWVDTPRGHIHRWVLETERHTRWHLGEPVGCIGLAQEGLVVGARSGFLHLDTASATLTVLADPERGRRGARMNDGKVDHAGRFWSGSLVEPGYPPTGHLWSLHASGCLVRHRSGVAMPNAICWSPDGKWMYFTDSFTGLVERYRYDPASGHLSEPEIFVHIPEGRGVGDGATTDADGYLWLAHIDGACVVRYDPEGRVDRVVPVPTRRPTSCCFGGPSLSTLYITTARRRLSLQELDEQPLAGHLLALDVDVAGIPEKYFGRPQGELAEGKKRSAPCISNDKWTVKRRIRHANDMPSS